MIDFVVLNNPMDNKQNDKVINMFAKHNKKLDECGEQKFFKGFHYVKLEKDVNGNPFQEELLLDYSKKCKYIVRVMRKVNGVVSLYNYKVPSHKFIEFISKFLNKEFNGEIIEVEKYIPEELA